MQRFPFTPCSICKSKHPIDATGPAPSQRCPIMLVGESPAKYEDLAGYCFVGPTGQELNELYLPEAGLRRPNVYVTNAQKCSVKRDINPWELRQCAKEHLSREIAAVDPDLIVFMGGSAASLVWGTDIDLMHGRPKRTTLYGKRRQVFFTYHPARGQHSPAEGVRILGDFWALRDFLAGELVIPKDEYPNRQYRLADRASFRRLMRGRPDALSLDSEILGTNEFRSPVWCLSISAEPGTGYLIRADDRATLDALADAVASRLPLYMHNAPFDIVTAIRLGVYPKHYRDTMQEAFHRGLPQSLKQLASRLCGMTTMREFADLVRPYAYRKHLAYLKTLAEYEWAPGEGRKWGLNRRVDAVLNAASKGRQDLYRRWRKIPNAMRKQAERSFGVLKPGLISDAPFEEAMYYACEDADATFRVAQALPDLKYYSGI